MLIRTDKGIDIFDKMDSGNSALNLDLFWTWERALEGSAKHQYFIMGNILLFVPYGVAVSALFSKEKCRWWKLLVIGVTTSVAIEYIQFVAHVGLCELDDVLHNTIGMMVGYWIIYLCRLYKSKL